MNDKPEFDLSPATSAERSAADEATSVVTSPSSPPSSPSSPAARVRARMASLTRMAVVAALPLANTACDPAPAPYCTNSPRATHLAAIRATAMWTVTGTSSVVVITLELGPEPGYYSLQYATFAVSGGRLSASRPAGTGEVLTITPDSGARQISVSASLTCDYLSIPFTAVIDLTNAPTNGAPIPVRVE